MVTKGKRNRSACIQFQSSEVLSYLVEESERQCLAPPSLTGAVEQGPKP